MPKRVGFSGQHQALNEILNHYTDTVEALKVYFAAGHPSFPVRFATYTPTQIARELRRRSAEVEMTSAFSVLSALEAAFRIDYLQRCYRKKKDPLSQAFRALHLAKGEKASLEDDILEEWKIHSTASTRMIGDLRGAFRLRHWIAHGRYWVPKLGRKYDFVTVYRLADDVFTQFPLEIR
jgi:hypothetical protein